MKPPAAVPMAPPTMVPATLPITGKNEPTTPPVAAPISPNNAAPPLVAAAPTLMATAPLTAPRTSPALNAPYDDAQSALAIAPDTPSNLLMEALVSVPPTLPNSCSVV